MTRFALIAALTVTTLNAQESDDSFEIEPPLLPQNLSREVRAEADATPAPIIDVARLEKDLERARKTAAGAERLYKMGALAKIEAEGRALKVVRLESDLENARLFHVKELALSAQSATEKTETPQPGTTKV